VAAGQLQLDNDNFDIGQLSRAGIYNGADEAYAKLVGKLADRQFAGTSPELRQNILAFYTDVKKPIHARSTAKEMVESAKLVDQLDRLKAIPAGGQ
jgi:hypothetical protein